MENMQIRNVEIFKKYIEGKKVKELTIEYGISRSRVHQICRKLERILTWFLKQHDIEVPDNFTVEFYLKQIDAYIKNGYTGRKKLIKVDPIEEQSIYVLDLSTRAYHGLHTLLFRYDYPDENYLIKDLLNFTTEDLLSVSNLGQKTVNEIKDALSAKGLFLKGN